jgi:hypothetical protein
MECADLMTEEAMATIRVVDFARSPGGRFASDGPSSGEAFRDEVLVPALTTAIAAGDVLTVELDGTSGYGSSFLEETFGGLIRLRKFPPSQIRRHLKIVAHDRLYAPFEALAARYLSAANGNASAGV